MSKPGRLWSELERDAHRMVLDMFEDGEAVDDAELIASRVVFARSDVTASKRHEYIDALTETVRRYMELLEEPAPVR